MDVPFNPCGLRPEKRCFAGSSRLETPESHLDSKEIKPITGRTDAEAEAPILWPPDEKNLFIGKDPDDGKD